MGSEVLLPLCVFPPVSWCALWTQGAVVDVGENFVKQSFRNRFEILSAQGRQLMTLPVAGTEGKKIPVSEVRLFGNDWQKRHLRALRVAYGKSPFYEHYAGDLEQLYLRRNERLSEFSLDALQWIASVIQLPMPATALSYVEAWQGIDYRDQFKHLPARQFPPYLQVFSDRQKFESDLSIIDLIMNEGPAASDYLRAIADAARQ
ncbi:MAG: WbqC family protein [Flavobacteriales bacterium]|nr:WbqC family protein [Flavobacteriales bacterium]